MGGDALSVLGLDRPGQNEGRNVVLEKRPGFVRIFQDVF